MLPSHQKQVLSEGDAAMRLQSIGPEVMGDYSPGFDEAGTVDDGDVETPVASCQIQHPLVLSTALLISQ